MTGILKLNEELVECTMKLNYIYYMREMDKKKAEKKEKNSKGYMTSSWENPTTIEKWLSFFAKFFDIRDNLIQNG